MPLKQFAFTENRKFENLDYVVRDKNDRAVWEDVLRHRAAVNSMLEQTWHKDEVEEDRKTYGNVRLGDLFRTEDGKLLRGQKMQVSVSQSEQRNFKSATGEDAVFAYFQANPKGKLQFLNPETRQPHYLTLGKNEKGEDCYEIGDAVPEIAAPPKPGLLDRFLNLFKPQDKVTQWKAYQAKKQERDSFVKLGTDILDKRERKLDAEKKAEEQIQKEKNAKKPEQVKEQVKEQIKEQVKEPVKEQVAEPEKAPAELKNTSLEEMAQRAEGAQMKQLAKWAVEARKRLNELPSRGPYNSYMTDFKNLGNGPVLNAAAVLALRLASENPKIADSVNNGNATMFLTEIAHSKAFLNVINPEGGPAANYRIFKDCVETGGSMLEKAYMKERAAERGPRQTAQQKNNEPSLQKSEELDGPSVMC